MLRLQAMKLKIFHKKKVRDLSSGNSGLKSKKNMHNFPPLVNDDMRSTIYVLILHLLLQMYNA